MKGRPANAIMLVVVPAIVGLTAKTVRNMVSVVLTKLQIADRAAAIVRAREAGLGRGPGFSGAG